MGVGDSRNCSRASQGSVYGDEDSKGNTEFTVGLKIWWVQKHRLASGSLATAGKYWNVSSFVEHGENHKVGRNSGMSGYLNSALLESGSRKSFWIPVRYWNLATARTY